MKIPKREVLRYLKMDRVAPNERLSALIGKLTDAIAANVVPKSVYGVWDCRVDLAAVSIDGMAVKSESLARLLAGCHRVVLLAATLGTEADTLLRRYCVEDMEKAVIAHAVCAAMIEAYCDSIEYEIAKKQEVSDLRLTTRFSPGYGDFDIAHQKDILSLLNCDKRIGLTMTTGYMLLPSKSVTAIIGFAESFADEKLIAKNKCGYCAEKLCEFRE